MEVMGLVNAAGYRKVALVTQQQYGATTKKARKAAAK
jgi:hypothetical protein